MLSHQLKIYWEQYNNNCTQKEWVVIVHENKAQDEKYGESYTHLFFRDFNLTAHMNTSCERILQFGASNGKFIEEYKEHGWSVIGYDYSQSAIKDLQKKRLPCRLVDLNAISSTKQLAYQNELIHDLANPINILLIRVLQYLELPAMNLLLFNLIDQAAPGSVIFIAGTIKENRKNSSDVSPTTRNYKLSLFGPRIDWEITLGMDAYSDDEVLVLRKRNG